EALGAVLDLLTQAPTDAPPIRIGIHIGEVVVGESGDLLGHGVNVAARLEALAQPGMALISRAAADLVRGDLHNQLVPRGRVTLDKMAETIDVLALDPASKPGRARPPRRRRAWINAVLAGAAAAAAVLVVLFATGLIGSRQQSEEDVNAIAREVMSQLVSSATASPTLPDGAYAAVLALERSTAPADQAAIAFLRVGEISRAVATLEQFAADLERRGAGTEAASAYARAANLAQFLDAQRSLRNARRAFDLEPTSLEGFEMVFMALRAIEGAPAADAFAEAVIARQSGRTRLRAFAKTIRALHVATVQGATSEIARNAVAAMESDVRAFPNDDLLQAYAERVRGGAAMLRNDVRAALAHASAARQRYQRVPGHELNGQTVWIRALELSGDWDRAWTESRAFIEERERLGAPPSLYLLGAACFIGQNLDRLAEAAPICTARARADPAETEKLLALIAASEGRLEEARSRLAASRRLRPYTDAYYASYEVDIYSLAGEFPAAEASLATFRRLTLADPTLAISAASDLARQLRTLGVRELKARRLRQACAMFAEAAQHYRSYGADPGVAAMELAQREARCPR
ncbi:MAG: adenylate/guanylate cyclase domain-containing protein, partial [Hyphomonadaceae bacterium]|nr:adenylate/guanylate cyclase domain-containing protein [Hyphomonadaceae bacterium]